ncbi:hypothetical protein BD414DRAFT_495472 [Trametes punicea]|nr:hypothetical protein BD414DRAFT_495472 [Trametes punicea]
MQRDQCVDKGAIEARQAGAPQKRQTEVWAPWHEVGQTDETLIHEDGPLTLPYPWASRRARTVGKADLQS